MGELDLMIIFVGVMWGLGALGVGYLIYRSVKGTGGSNWQGVYIMNLKDDTLKVKLVFELNVETDHTIDPKHVVNIIADEIRIRKKYDGFVVNGFEMDYEVRKNTDMMDV